MVCPSVRWDNAPALVSVYLPFRRTNYGINISVNIAHCEIIRARIDVLWQRWYNNGYTTLAGKH